MIRFPMVKVVFDENVTPKWRESPGFSRGEYVKT